MEWVLPKLGSGDRGLVLQGDGSSHAKRVSCSDLPHSQEPADNNMGFCASKWESRSPVKCPYTHTHTQHTHLGG